jgi:hypothetical protein
MILPPQMFDITQYKIINERIKNIIELKCKIELEIRFKKNVTNHAYCTCVYETSFVHKAGHVYACQ